MSKQKQIIDEAAQWMALIGSGQASEAEQRAFAEWQARDPRHAQMIGQFLGSLEQLQSSPLGQLVDGQLIQTVNAPSSRRRFLGKSAGLLGLAGVAWLVSRIDRTGFVWPGDLVTGTAERRQLQLPDGSQLILNARSRISMQFNDNRRRIHLHAGELQLSIEPDQRSALHLSTDEGHVSSSNARLQLRRHDNYSRLLVSHSEVELHTRDGQTRHILAGQQALFDGRGLLDIGLANDGMDSWTSGLLRVKDQPLAELIESLRPYRQGIIQLSPKAAVLRVSGIYPLDDNDLALQVLKDSLQLKIDYLTPLWVVIDKA